MAKSQLRTVLICTAAMLAASCNGVLDPVGPVGSAEKQILRFLRDHAGDRHPDNYRDLGSPGGIARQRRRAICPTGMSPGAIELVVWSIPRDDRPPARRHRVDRRRALDPPSRSNRGAAARVEVVSLDWKWLFIYPEQGSRRSTSCRSRGRADHLQLTSAAVMNSSSCPVRPMIYTMHG